MKSGTLDVVIFRRPYVFEALKSNYYGASRDFTMPLLPGVRPMSVRWRGGKIPPRETAAQASANGVVRKSLSKSFFTEELPLHS